MILIWRTKSVLDDQEHSKTKNCRHWWMKTHVSQKQLAEAFNCAQSVISDRLKTLGKVYKEGKRKSYMNWSQETLKGEKSSAKFCLLDNKEKFLHCTEDEKWIYFNNPNRKTVYDPANPQHRRQSGISTERRQCSVFGGIRRV